MATKHCQESQARPPWPLAPDLPELPPAPPRCAPPAPAPPGPLLPPRPPTEVPPALAPPAPLPAEAEPAALPVPEGMPPLLVPASPASAVSLPPEFAPLSLLAPLLLLSVAEKLAEQPTLSDKAATPRPKRRLIECPRARLMPSAYHALGLVRQPRRDATACRASAATATLLFWGFAARPADLTGGERSDA